ncbi:hypothetical protein RF11_06875 [Thelohanellus kitauei]|uniref:Uncharacterized protein n=1 Tax=Thelohanellus kitauei TaxID=669202 RepID=A0A0C2IAA1_THEKT|nr:hypothetical protein RF11_06875 [Thelohanellus kitauei]
MVKESENSSETFQKGDIDKNEQSITPCSEAVDEVDLRRQWLAREYLEIHYQKSANVRMAIQVFEPQIIEKIKLDSKSWQFCCKFQTSIHFFIFKKLCEYYGVEMTFCQICQNFKYCYSPTQRLKPTISDISVAMKPPPEFQIKYICHKTLVCF